MKQPENLAISIDSIASSHLLQPVLEEMRFERAVEMEIQIAMDTLVQLRTAMDILELLF